VTLLTDENSKLRLQYTHTHTHTHTHTRLFSYTSWDSIGLMVFILYKLYILSPYTNPTPIPTTHTHTNP